MKCNAIKLRNNMKERKTEREIIQTIGFESFGIILEVSYLKTKTKSKLLSFGN